MTVPGWGFCGSLCAVFKRALWLVTEASSVHVIRKHGGPHCLFLGLRTPNWGSRGRAKLGFAPVSKLFPVLCFRHHQRFPS